MNKKYDSGGQDLEANYQKKKSRLIANNRHLYSEIFKLEHKMNAVFNQNIDDGSQQKIQDQSTEGKFKELFEDQRSQIKKLKNKILLIKNSEKPQQKQQVRQALDELRFLKRERQKYFFEKQTLNNRKVFKQEALQFNKPIQEQQKQLLSLFKAAKHENFELKTKILKIEREINSLHKVKELAKTSVLKSSKDAQFQMKKIQQQLTKLKNQIKDVEKQWQPRVESLDTEYFILKDIKQQKKSQTEQIQKKLQTFKNRVLVMKQEAQILNDKNRVAQVSVSPEKRQEIYEIYKQQKQKREFIEQFRDRSCADKLVASKISKISPSKSSKSPIKSSEKQLESELFKNKSIISQNQVNKIIKSQTEQKNDSINLNSFQFNEFQVKKQIFESKSPKKQNKELKKMQSVAVGTTFYYEEYNEND